MSQCCGQVSYSDDISDDAIDCLFDDIDKFFELEPLPLATDKHNSAPAELSSDQTEHEADVVSHDHNDGLSSGK